MVTKAKQLFDIGDKVMALWPGSKLWFSGTVIDLNDVSYLVRFDDPDKCEYPIKYSQVKQVFSPRKSPSRSLSRGRSPGRGKGRGRPVGETSPKRSPGRPKSSPGRPKKPNQSPAASPSRKAAVITPTRRSARVATIMTSDRRETNNSSNNAKVMKVLGREAAGGHSSLAPKVGCIFAKALHTVMPSWGSVSTVPMVLLTLTLPMLVNLICSKPADCTLSKFPSIPRRLDAYFNIEAILVVVSFLAVNYLLALIPIGRVVSLKRGAKFRCNGMIAFIVFAGVVPATNAMGYNPLRFYALNLQLISTCTALGVLLAVIAFFAARWSSKDAMNPNGSSGSFLADLFEGRVTNPQLGSVDLKSLLFRSALTGSVIVNTIILMKEMSDRKSGISPVLLTSCLIQLWLGFDMSWFEDSFLTTYEYNRQGFGLFLTTGYLTFPFMYSLISRYIYEHLAFEMPWYCLFGIIVLGIVGYLMARRSLWIKHYARTHSSLDDMKGLELISSSSGSRLIVSGLWGVVRHPNYLGDIMLMAAMTLLCGFHHALPWILFGMNTFYLVFRSYQVEAVCKKKYRSAWANYVSRVPNRLVPRVY